MFGLVGKRKTLRKMDKEQLGRFSFAWASLMGPQPCRNPHLACRGGAGPTASCSHQQTSRQRGEGWLSSRSDGGASSEGLLELAPARARQTPWTVLAGPGSYLRMAKGNKAIRAETPTSPDPQSPQGRLCHTGCTLMPAQPCIARPFNNVQPLQRKREFSFAKKHHPSAYSSFR